LTYAATRAAVIAYALKAAKDMAFVVVRCVVLAAVRMLRRKSTSEQAAARGRAHDDDPQPVEAPCDDSPFGDGALGGEDNFLGVSRWLSPSAPSRKARSASDECAGDEGDDDDLDATQHYVWDNSTKSYVPKGGAGVVAETSEANVASKELSQANFLNSSAEAADLSAASTALAHSHMSDANVSLGALHFEPKCADEVRLVGAGAGEAQEWGGAGKCQRASAEKVGILAAAAGDAAGDDEVRERLLSRIYELESRIKDDLALQVGSTFLSSGLLFCPRSLLVMGWIVMAIS